MRLGLVLGELEQAQGPLDVHLVRGDRRELRARREQRGEMEDEIDFEFRHHPLEQRAIRDRAGDLAIDLAGDRVVEPRDVDRDDAAIAALGEAIDEAVVRFRRRRR